jgi:hypothetical protein
MSKQRRIVLGLLGPLLLAVAVPAAGSAQTGWTTFGAASAAGRGSWGSPSVSFSSTTRRSPTVVRLTFNDGTRTKRTEISWDISCWNEQSFDFWDRSGSGSYRLPKTVTWDPPAWVNFCEVDADSYHFDTGVLRITAQARYP